MRLHTHHAEPALVEYLGQVGAYPLGWAAIHLRLSQRAETERSDRQFGIAANAIAELVRDFEGCLFRCANADLVLICKGLKPGQVHQIAGTLRYLFSSDAPSGAEEGAETFATWYDPSVRLPDLFGIAQALLDDQRHRESDAQLVEPERQGRPPLDPARLLKLQVVLGSLDVTGLIRRQPICRLGADGAFRSEFEELYIRVADLERVTMPGIDFRQNRWLFQYLSKSLDQRVPSRSSATGRRRCCADRPAST